MQAQHPKSLLPKPLKLGTIAKEMLKTSCKSLKHSHNRNKVECTQKDSRMRRAELNFIGDYMYIILTAIIPYGINAEQYCSTAQRQPVCYSTILFNLFMKIYCSWHHFCYQNVFAEPFC